MAKRKKKKSLKVPLIAAGVVVLGLIGAGASGGESKSEPAVAETAVVETVKRSAPEPKDTPSPSVETEAVPAEKSEPAPEPVVEVVEPEQKDAPSPSVETETVPAEKSEPAPEPQKLTVAVHNAGRSVSLAPDTLVWLSATGTKFHRKNNCGTMNPDKARQVTAENAVNKGFDACERCY